MRPLALSTAIAVVLLAAIATPAGALTFSSAPGSPITVGSHPRPLAVGDFNRDGVPDLVTGNLGNTSNGTLSVLLGDGSGGFRQAPGSPIGPIKGPISIAVGDFNRDGRQDMAVANAGVGTVTVLLGKRLGWFYPGVRVPRSRSAATRRPWRSATSTATASRTSRSPTS